MGEEITNTVKTTSDGMVSITVEKYHELLAQAQTKPPVVRHVTKTPEVAASENKAWGATFIVFGVTTAFVGVLRFAAGMSQQKALRDK